MIVIPKLDRPLFFACTVALVVGCAPGPGQESIPVADVAGYMELHPYVEARCATLDCHGDPGRPMRIFSETGLRMAGIDRDSAITPAEMEANAITLVGVDPSAPSADRHLLLLKPLAEAEGGMDHVGDEVWLSRDDPGARCLEGWLGNAGDEAWRAECASARSMFFVLPDDPPM